MSGSSIRASSGLVDECLRKHQFLTGPPGEVLAEHVFLVGKVKEVKPPCGLFIDIGDLPYCAHELQVLGRRKKTRGRLLLGDDPDTLPDTDRIVLVVDPKHRCRAGSRPDLAGQHFYHR